MPEPIYDSNTQTQLEMIKIKERLDKLEKADLATNQSILNEAKQTLELAKQLKSLEDRIGYTESDVHDLEEKMITKPKTSLLSRILGRWKRM